MHDIMLLFMARERGCLVHLVDILSMCAFEPDTQFNGIIITSIEEMEVNGTRGRSCHPDAIISVHSNNCEEGREPL